MTMKKQISILSLVFLITIVIWIILANKFERQAKETLIPKLKEYVGIISFDQESIEINKFRFKIILNDFKITFPTYYLDYECDQISLFYKPFTKNISIRSTGKKMLLKWGNLFEYYVPNPEYQLEFSKSLVDLSFEEFEISLSGQNEQIYNAKNNLLLSSTGLTKSFIKGKKFRDTENYIINLGIEERDISITQNFFDSNKEIGKQLTKDIKRNNIPSYNLEVMDKYIDSVNALLFNEKNNPHNLKITTELVISKDLSQAIIDFILRDREALSRFNLMNSNLFSKDILDFRLSANSENANASHSIVTNFTNNNDKFLVNFVLKNNSLYGNKPEKVEYFASLWSNLLFNFYNLIQQNDQANDSSTAIKSAEDFMPMAKFITDINSSQLNLGVKYSSSNDFSYVIKTGINHHNIEVSSDIEPESYKIQVKIDRPKSTILAIANNLETTFLPMWIKLNEQAANTQVLENNISEFVANLRTNGMGFLRALHNQRDLTEEDAFLCDITIRNSPDGENNITINSHPYVEILKDSRIIKFLPWANALIKQE